MKNCKSYAAYKAYQSMYTDMTLVDVDGQLKIECNYDYREPIKEKLTPANTNREEALKATNAVISRLTRIGRLQEFEEQIQEMETMGTILALTDTEIKDLETRPHNFNKLNYTLSSTSATTPVRVLRDSTSKMPNVGGIFSVMAMGSPPS